MRVQDALTSLEHCDLGNDQHVAQGRAGFKADPRVSQSYCIDLSGLLHFLQFWGFVVVVVVWGEIQSRESFVDTDM